MKITFYTDDCEFRLPCKWVTKRWLRRVSREEGCTVEGLNYIFCSSDRLLAMNREFLGHDYRTDVITFQSGEVYIDLETVAENAKTYDAPFLTELRRVMVHGLLHLCGQGDKEGAEAVQMRAKEEKYLGWI